VTSPLSPVPGPQVSDKEGRLTPLWQSWFYQLYTFLTASSSGGGGTVPATRKINTSAPLAGGGALTSDLTLSVGQFGASSSGVVPPSGGGAASLLRADGTWANSVSGAFSASDLSATATVSAGTTVGAGTSVSAGTSVTAATFVKTGAVAVGSLPSAVTAGAGAHEFVTDSTVVAAGNFGAIVAGGGANGVPVYSDGTNWRIG